MRLCACHGEIVKKEGKAIVVTEHLKFSQSWSGWWRHGWALMSEN
jgi:hypothetical protein